MKKRGTKHQPCTAHGESGVKANMKGVPHETAVTDLFSQVKKCYMIPTQPKSCHK